jgi:hypothetical protein
MQTAVDKNTLVALTYREFENLVNRSLSNKCGLGFNDFPDFDLWNYFDEGMELTMTEWKKAASECANEMLEEEGFFRD